VHRWRTLQHPDDKCIYSTGTDEHGMKVQKAAFAAEKRPAEFCGDISDEFKVCACAVQVYDELSGRGATKIC